MDVSGRTRIVGIFGDPVTHSLSPSMHNAAFRALRLDYLYVAFHVLPTQLRRAVAGIRALDLVGVNITVPHKQRVMIMLDSVGARAQRAGAVNTIINRGGQLHGENTDIDGFLRAVGAAQVELRGARVLLVGAGGAARGALAGLGEAGVSAVTVVNRTPQRARQLAAAMGRCGASATAAPLSALRDRVLLGNTDLVVNATSLGLAGEPFFQMEYAATPDHCVFFDLIYGKRTDFLTRAARARRRCIDGGDMLVHQGAAAFTLWTGRRPSIRVMATALQSAARASQKRVELTTRGGLSSVTSGVKRGHVRG